MYIKNLFIIALACAFMAACGGEAQQATSGDTDRSFAKGQSTVSDDVSNPNILQVAIGSADHSTLVAGVQAAEMEDILANAGPLTVFAPNNAAFDKLPAGVLDDLLKPENKAKLAKIITYHAAPGNYKGDLLKDSMNLYQATGDNVLIRNVDGKVTVNGANVLGTVEASNGVVHVIDQVLLPPEKK